MRSIRISPLELKTIRDISGDHSSLSYVAAYQCDCRNHNSIIFDAIVTVSPTLSQRIHKTSPSGIVTIPDYIPSDATNFVFIGFSRKC